MIFNSSSYSYKSARERERERERERRKIYVRYFKENKCLTKLFRIEERKEGRKEGMGEK